MSKPLKRTCQEKDGDRDLRRGYATDGATIGMEVRDRVSDRSPFFGNLRDLGFTLRVSQVRHEISFEKSSPGSNVKTTTSVR